MKYMSTLIPDEAICYMCGKKAWRRERKGINRNWTGRYLCMEHYSRYYQKDDPNSSNNIKKSLADHRTGNLRYQNHILGDNGEKLTNILFEVKRLSIEHDKYSESLDHTPISQGISIMIGERLVDLSKKVPQTVCTIFKRYIGAKGGWIFTSLEREWGKEFDVEILWCISEDGLNVERGYIVPKIEIEEGKSITIVKDPSKGYQWYESYRITDKELLKKANEAWRKIISYDIE